MCHSYNRYNLSALGQKKYFGNAGDEKSLHSGGRKFF